MSDFRGWVADFRGFLLFGGRFTHRISLVERLCGISYLFRGGMVLREFFRENWGFGLGMPVLKVPYWWPSKG
jgi:hypothetical protein